MSARSVADHFRSTVFRARLLGRGPLGGAWLILVSVLLMRIKDRVTAFRCVPIPLALSLNDKSVTYWVRDRSHISNLDEVWRFGEYASISDGPFTLILDLGANIGASATWLHDRFPEARIIAVEPDPRNAELLRRNTAAHSAICVLEAAVGPEEGTAAVLLARESWASRLVEPYAEATTIRVPVVTIHSLLGENPGRVLIKMDIEGSEWAVLAEHAAILGITELYGEWHPHGAPEKPEQFFETFAANAGMISMPGDRRFHLVRPS
jgi:FkbM family methyltransferase